MKMICYQQVYVPCFSCLLRLSNEIETNPGSTVYVDSNKTVCADFSQGCQIGFGQNEGKQCVAMSLTSIVFSCIQHVSRWNSSVNTILLHGHTRLYSYNIPVYSIKS